MRAWCTPFLSVHHASPVHPIPEHPILPFIFPLNERTALTGMASPAAVQRGSSWGRTHSYCSQ